MAILHQTGGRGNYVLSIIPVWSTLEGPHDAYDLTLILEGRTLYNRRHSGKEWLSGHWVMIDLACDFQYASQLIGIEPDFTYNDKGEIEHSYKPRSTHADAYWIEIVLTGLTLASGIKGVILSCFLRVDPDPETGMERFIVVRFKSSLEECEQFGETCGPSVRPLSCGAGNLGCRLKRNENTGTSFRAMCSLCNHNWRFKCILFEIL